MPAIARALPPGYVPGRPEETVLYRIVKGHLDELLEHVDASYAAPLPKYVIDEFREYLACGKFDRGFLRCRCDECGHDMLVAFSCKRRGMCPSCANRRMCNEAAHLTDRVLPNVPIRQWVLSLPFPLRRLAAFRADVLTALSGMFVEEIFRATGVRTKETEGGAVTFVQRFGGSLNLNVHFHVVVLDGAFERRADGARFRESPPPSHEAIERVARRVYDRALRWLRRNGHLDAREPEHRSNANDESALDACARLALFSGGLTDAGDDRDPDHSRGPFDAPAPKRFSARYEGFDVHAAVRIEANDDDGRERLLRYCARPPFALDRLSLTGDGQVSYRVKYARGRRTHRVMSPVEFLARLAALIPPPKFPLVRYHGVLAPNSKWRKHVVPRLSEDQRCQLDVKKAEAPGCTKHERPQLQSPPSRQPAPSRANNVAMRAPSQPVAALAHNAITVRHWGRLLDGALLATASRIPWADLLRRTHGVEALVCPTCQGPVRVLAAITEPATAKAILGALGVVEPPKPKPPAPSKARARRPSQQLVLPFAAG